MLLDTDLASFHTHLVEDILDTACDIVVAVDVVAVLKHSSLANFLRNNISFVKCVLFESVFAWLPNNFVQVGK